CLQPIGSFKLRGATNAMRRLAAEDPERLSRGVYTASAGNMAQGVAWSARALGIPCTVVVPDTAPATKLAAVERLGAEIDKRPFDEWWRVIAEHGDPLMTATFIHPFADPDVLAGSAWPTRCGLSRGPCSTAPSSSPFAQSPTPYACWSSVPASWLRVPARPPSPRHSPDGAAPQRSFASSRAGISTPANCAPSCRAE